MESPKDNRIPLKRNAGDRFYADTGGGRSGLNTNGSQASRAYIIEKDITKSRPDTDPILPPEGLLREFPRTDIGYIDPAPFVNSNPNSPIEGSETSRFFADKPSKGFKNGSSKGNTISSITKRNKVTQRMEVEDEEDIPRSHFNTSRKRFDLSGNENEDEIVLPEDENDIFLPVSNATWFRIKRAERPGQPTIQGDKERPWFVAFDRTRMHIFRVDPFENASGKKLPRETDVANGYELALDDYEVSVRT